MLMSVLFGVDFYYFAYTSILSYALIILASAAAITWVKSLLGRFMEIRATTEPWVSGFIVSAVATLLLSLLGLPILVPVMSSAEHKRATTLRGLKKGEVNIHESWSFSIFSSLIIVLIGLLLISLWTRYHNPGFMAAGSFSVLYVLVNLLPHSRFDGAFLAYHNLPVYSIVFGFTLVIAITAIFYFVAAFAVFLVFAAFSFISLRMKLW